MAKSLSLEVRGDLGGFGLGSNFTWQIEPLLNWHFSQLGSLQGGYRWLSTDYETGSGNTLFRYDMLKQGFQLGVTFHF